MLSDRRGNRPWSLPRTDNRTPSPSHAPINGATPVNQLAPDQASRLTPHASVFVPGRTTHANPSPSDDRASDISASLEFKSSISSAKFIEDIRHVIYPEGVRSPSTKLNVSASAGKFRYDRPFLLQFMTVCTYKPIDLPSLEDIGVVPTDKVPHRASYVPINPMQASMNVWRSHSPLEGQVKALLRQLSTTKFDSVSVRLITLANRSEEEVTGQTLMLVIRLVVGSAIDKAEPQLHTRLCHAIMEGIHMDVRNKKILDREGKPWSGEKLVRMYLFNACQEAFKTLRIVFTNGASMTYLGGAGHERMEAAQTKTTKRRTHALIRFIVELFVSRIVYNQLVFACMDNLLGVGPADWVDEEDIELLSEVFVRTGSLLGSCANMTDFHKRKTAGMLKHRFIRIEMLASSQDASSRIRQILQSIIELRDRGWVV